jgi:hypothetical protein
MTMFPSVASSVLQKITLKLVKRLPWFWLEMARIQDRHPVVLSPRNPFCSLLWTLWVQKTYLRSLQDLLLERTAVFPWHRLNLPEIFSGNCQNRRLNQETLQMLRGCIWRDLTAGRNCARSWVCRPDLTVPRTQDQFCVAPRVARNLFRPDVSQGQMWPDHQLDLSVGGSSMMPGAIFALCLAPPEGSRCLTDLGWLPAPGLQHRPTRRWVAVDSE